MLNFYISLSLTDIVLDPISRFKIAYLLIFYNCFAIGTNLLIILGFAIFDAIKTLKRNSMKKKMS